MSSSIVFTAPLLVLATVAALTGAQQFACPHDYGFYAHDIACDKYWACDLGVATLKTCGNGLAFDDTDPENLKENCDYLHNVKCGKRTELQPPIVVGNCKALHGIFPDDSECEVFHSCWAGEGTRYQCGPGLAYDRRSRTCSWMDQVPECKQQRADALALTGIQCPEAGRLSAVGSFTRHAHPDDCRLYYACFDGVPREYGCPIGTVFAIGQAEGEGQCQDPKTVPGCEDYYGDIDISVLKTLGL
ncbi:protein obstructor-E isoform X1 [Hyalella azteca]|uniref:Protein obstructor-E isoform X1 n=1 Tax=Hyalella azteca TaxID=294128 RepID=A0A8B7PA19_HYAAZ|nr:protein obstructor-E isoform X1 [Hyalella azteca]